MHRYCYHKERNYIFSYSQIVSYRALSDERPIFVLSTQSRNHCDIPLINKRMVVVSERSFSFKKGALFPHSYDMEHPLIIGILHIFDIILFLHQTTTVRTVLSPWPRCISFFSNVCFIISASLFHLNHLSQNLHLEQGL